MLLKLLSFRNVGKDSSFGVQTNAHFTERLLSKTFPTLSSPLAHLFPKWRVEGFVAEEKPLKATKWGNVPTL